MTQGQFDNVLDALRIVRDHCERGGANCKVCLYYTGTGNDCIRRVVSDAINAIQYASGDSLDAQMLAQAAKPAPTQDDLVAMAAAVGYLSAIGNMRAQVITERLAETVGRLSRCSMLKEIVWDAKN